MSMDWVHVCCKRISCRLSSRATLLHAAVHMLSRWRATRWRKQRRHSARFAASLHIVSSCASLAQRQAATPSFSAIIIKQQVVKEFRPKAASQGDFYGGGSVTWHRLVVSIAVRWISGALMPLLIFLQRTTQLWLTMLFSGPVYPKIALSAGGICTLYSMVPWAHPNQIPKRHLSRFCIQDSRTWPTDRHTDRPRYSVSSNRPHLAIASTPPMNNNNNNNNNKGKAVD